MRVSRQAFEAQRTGLVNSAQDWRPRPVREASPEGSYFTRAPQCSRPKILAGRPVSQPAAVPAEVMDK